MWTPCVGLGLLGTFKGVLCRWLFRLHTVSWWNLILSIIYYNWVPDSVLGVRGKGVKSPPSKCLPVQNRLPDKPWVLRWDPLLGLFLLEHLEQSWATCWASTISASVCVCCVRACTRMLSPRLAWQTLPPQVLVVSPLQSQLSPLPALDHQNWEPTHCKVLAVDTSATLPGQESPCVWFVGCSQAQQGATGYLHEEY
jgi:hypothetical protein